MLLIFSFQFNTKINFTIKLSFQLKFEEINKISWKSLKPFKIENPSILYFSTIFELLCVIYVNKYSTSFATNFINIE